MIKAYQGEAGTMVDLATAPTDEVVTMTTTSDFRAGGVVTNPATAAPPLRLHPDECLLVRRSDRWVCIREEGTR